MQVRKMCIIGAGTMGTGIAQVAAQAGIQTTLMDASAESLDRSRRTLDRSLNTAVEREKLTPAQADGARALVAWSAHEDPIAEADWIVEAVFEDAEIKGRVLRRICDLARHDSVITTNTSTLPIHELATYCFRPERFIGMHFFNPVPVMKLVEVIPWQGSAPQTTRFAISLCERLGKTPVVAPDIPGFLVNRAFGALVATAIDTWQAGADPQAIDDSLELGLGHKMGPLRTADLVGLDVTLALLQSLWDHTGDERFRVPAVLVEMVKSGKLGRKSGEGFYKYED
ncbi:MAG: 3-hydroxyacyl-CoA dehydrogenase family protein [Acidobacteriota bacterium]|jgi:3-hydroxybutyryl-CoA dehydrogenase|nr:3-hydroxyacyl-CoA dehydrogenase family protein [Acidobacteriota bacterium]